MKHLRVSYHIDPQATSTARKRDENGSAVNIALRRQAESFQDIKNKDQKYKERVVDKTILEYLYIR